MELGKGSNTLFKEKEELMNNWEHKDSKHIIIASLPEAFHHLDIMGTPLFQKRHAAFYNNILPEEATKLGIAPGLYLKPEFIMGMYDAKKKDFVENDRYYENLPVEEQKKIFEDVKKQYIDIISHSDFTLTEYAQVLEDIGLKSPLTPEEISNNGKEVKQQIDMVELPNGIKIPRKQYEEEYGTKKPEKEMVTLPNGVQIPKKQYEEEFETQKPVNQSERNYLIDRLGMIGVAAGIAVGEGINGATTGARAGGKLSTQKIGKATINVPTSKKREVQSAEDKEKVKGENQRNDE